MILRASGQETGEREHRSPGFGMITSHLRADHKQQVLELGAANTPNIEFLSELQCKVYVEHLGAVLDELNALSMDTESGIRLAVDQLLAYPQGLRFDVALAWDLLNYLEPAAMETLVARLSTFCKQGTLLFALVYTGKQIPSSPRAFKMAADDRLLYDVSSDRPRHSPQYSTPVLLKKLPGFTVLRSYLLQNYIQEYVFRFQ